MAYLFLALALFLAFFCSRPQKVIHVHEQTVVITQQPEEEDFVLTEPILHKI